jgi:hypothetical protein
MMATAIAVAHSIVMEYLPQVKTMVRFSSLASK